MFILTQYTNLLFACTGKHLQSYWGKYAINQTTDRPQLILLSMTGNWIADSAVQTVQYENEEDLETTLQSHIHMNIIIQVNEKESPLTALLTLPTNT